MNDLATALDEIDEDRVTLLLMGGHALSGSIVFVGSDYVAITERNNASLHLVPFTSVVSVRIP